MKKIAVAITIWIVFIVSALVVFVCGFSIANEIKADRSEKVYVYRKDAKVKEIKKEQLYSLVKDYNFFDFCNEVKNILI